MDENLKAQYGKCMRKILDEEFAEAFKRAQKRMDDKFQQTVHEAGLAEEESTHLRDDIMSEVKKINESLGGQYRRMLWAM